MQPARIATALAAEVSPLGSLKSQSANRIGQGSAVLRPACRDGCKQQGACYGGSAAGSLGRIPYNSLAWNTGAYAGALQSLTLTFVESRGS